jgi:uncharacterized protein
MRLALRNQIAEWLLEALAEPAAEAPLRALVVFARRSDDTGVATGLTESETSALATEERLFESTLHGLELREDLLGDLDRLRWRAQRFAEALAACREACGAAPTPWRVQRMRPGSGPLDPAELTWSLCAAAALFNAELFFEVHELLEPPWGRAEGPLRPFLQGLIQVAVGLHHRSTGNLRGSVSLLADGNAKLRPFVPEAWGVELATLCSEVDAIVGRLREAADPSATEISLPRLIVG